MYDTFENVVAMTHKNCSQLFFLYSGLMRTVGGLRALGFVQKTGLHDRNVVMFKDPYMAGYGRGVSEKISDLDALVTWQREYCQAHPHLRDIYCIGVSAGAFPAIYAGYLLKAKAVWSFGARPPARKYWGQDPETLLVKQANMRQQRREHDVDIENNPLWELEECMLDVEIISKVHDLLLTANGVTEYHLYYSPSNDVDSLTHAMIADLPGTTSHTVIAPADYPHNSGPAWDHKVLPIIQHQGGLPTLFPPFV